MSELRATDPPTVPPVLILAAGKGTRLQEVGRRTPKVLVPIGGRPLLDRHLDHLAQQGARRVIVNSHHLAEQLADHLAGYAGPLEIDIAYEPQLLGTAGAAVAAIRRVDAERIIVLYGDVMVFEPLAGLLAAHERSGAAATLAVYEYHDLSGKGVVVTDRDGWVTGFLEKGQTEGPGWVNAGLYVVESHLLAGLPRGAFLDFGHDVFPAALAHGSRLMAYELGERVLDIGTPEDLARARGTA